MLPFMDIQLTEESAKQVALYVAIFTIINSICSLVLFGFGIYLFFYLQSKSHLSDDNSITTVGAFYMIFALLFFAAQMVVIVVIYKWGSRNSPRSEGWITQRCIKFSQRGIIIVCAIALIMVIIIYFSHLTSVKDSISKGLLANMKKYSSDSENKAIIDDLQLEYACCGSNGYKDWFKEKWLHKDNKKSMDPSSSLPFSCCNVNYLGACQTENLVKFPPKESINTKGCAENFSNHVQLWVKISLILWILVLLVQMVIGFVMRNLMRPLKGKGEDKPLLRQDKSSDEEGNDHSKPARPLRPSLSSTLPLGRESGQSDGREGGKTSTTQIPLQKKEEAKRYSAKPATEEDLREIREISGEIPPPPPPSPPGPPSLSQQLKSAVLKKTPPRREKADEDGFSGVKMRNMPIDESVAELGKQFVAAFQRSPPTKEPARPPPSSDDDDDTSKT